MSNLAGSGPERIDAFIEQSLLDADPALAACVTRCRDAGLPDIAVTAPQAKFLQLLVAAAGAKAVLEVGTLGGFSTIFLARGAGEGGRVVTLELDEGHAELARANIAAAALSASVEVIAGPALDSLARLEGPFDFAFLDADKENNSAYVDHAARLARDGALIVVDNVVREGRILDPDPANTSDAGSRALYAHVAAHPQLDATALQTVGAKPWDGMLIARVRKGES